MAEPSLRKRKPGLRSAVVAATATAPLTMAGVVAVALASAADSCDNGAVMPLGKYYAGDNLRGQDSVKPYASAVLGQNVHSFVRTSNTSGANLDMDDFPRALVQHGKVSSSTYPSSVQAGTEIFTGQGRPDTSPYAVTVG